MLRPSHHHRGRLGQVENSNYVIKRETHSNWKENQFI